MFHRHSSTTGLLRLLLYPSSLSVIAPPPFLTRPLVEKLYEVRWECGPCGSPQCCVFQITLWQCSLKIDNTLQFVRTAASHRVGFSPLCGVVGGFAHEWYDTHHLQDINVTTRHHNHLSTLLLIIVIIVINIRITAVSLRGEAKRA